MARWGKLSYAQKTCLGKVGLLMQQAGMLREGARVGVAVSGGVDSFLLLQLLIMRRRIVPFSFEIMALHVNPGFDPVAHLPLAAWIREQGLAAHLELTDHGPRAHSPENRKGSACFFCARLRRKRLFALCQTYGLTHLAFAHTADDLAATFLMNLVLTGKVYGLAAREEYFGGELTLGAMDDAFRHADIVYPKSWAPMRVMERRTELLEAGDSRGLDELERQCLAENERHVRWECTEKLMASTRGGQALYMHCLPADISGVSCRRGEVAASVFERYRLPTYREAGHKPFIIAAIILLTRLARPEQVLAKLHARCSPRIL